MDEIALSNFGLEIREDNSSNILIPLIVLFVFVIFLTWMLALLIGSGFKSTSTQNSSLFNPSATANSLVTSCSIDECATNRITGEKRCPSVGETILADTASEVCNPRERCTNRTTPYALLSDGSTNFDGICEEGVACPCVSKVRCPNYIASLFTTSNGNTNKSFTQQRLTFPQIPALSGKTYTPTPIDNPGTTFCKVPPSWLVRSSPGCNFIDALNFNSINYDNLLLCTGIQNGCQGLEGSPCLNGVLAVISNNPDSLTKENVIRSQVGCVFGKPCPCGLLPIYDTNFGGIVCKSLE